MRVYLAGPITGQSPDQIGGWRASFRKLCEDIEFIDPASTDIDASNAFSRRETASEALRRLSHGRFVLDRNRTLIKKADAVLANFQTTPDRASIGTVGELFWANAFGKPIIIVRQKFHNIHDHAMLNALATRICYSLEEGRDALVSLGLSNFNIA
jgi:nucleoside 2-deoxyribosyltransferase